MIDAETVDRYLQSGGKVMMYLDENGNIQHTLLGRSDEVYGSTSGILETFLSAYPNGDLREFISTYLASRKRSNI